ncbi:TonB-dependent receptor [Flavobacterium sp. 3HN19-14]|uniref:TonB-dependent receptor n=1 Tax=Flavobacterium sp. 3HN19-14 TaxID=3448133 RepID=UPI003EE037A6
MKINFKHTLAFIITFAALPAFAQKDPENIGTEVVNVVKPYTPTISDAFKVKETPSLDDEETLKKETITYNIFSFPVASTFTPAKGKAVGVDKEEQEHIYKNYATLGFGTYAAVNAELFITENLSDTDYVGGMLRHQSSQGNIKGVELDDKFYDTSLDLTYGSRTPGFSWTADLGYQNQVYNWYGLEEGVLTETQIDAIDPAHTFHNFYIGARLNSKDGFFSEASIKYNRFWDALGSAENRFYVKPKFSFDIMDTKVNTDFVVDYVGGTFEKDYYRIDTIDTNYVGLTSLEYSYVNFGVQPSILYQKDDLSVNLGAGIFYSSGKQNGRTDGKLFIYPAIKASYKVVGDLMIFYAGAEGGLRQNSYRDFTNENPFLSPTLIVAPTDNQYDIYAGLKGKLANNVSYNIRGGYNSEKSKPLFTANAYDAANTNTEGYAYTNSFQVVYDDVKTLSFFGELKADFSKSVTFGINGTFNSYKTSIYDEAWNLPGIELGSSLDVAITKKWFAGANVFFVGERKDVFASDLSVQTLDSYFDANLNVGYKYNERLTAFLKANNIANQAYEKWINYPVQQFQLMLGASYKFDF